MKCFMYMWEVILLLIVNDIEKLEIDILYMSLVIIIISNYWNVKIRDGDCFDVIIKLVMGIVSRYSNLYVEY